MDEPEDVAVDGSIDEIVEYIVKKEGPKWDRVLKVIDVIMAGVDKHIEIECMIEEQELRDSIAEAGARWEVDHMMENAGEDWQSQVRQATRVKGAHGATPAEGDALASLDTNARRRRDRGGDGNFIADLVGEDSTDGDPSSPMPVPREKTEVVIGVAPGMARFVKL